MKLKIGQKLVTFGSLVIGIPMIALTIIVTVQAKAGITQLTDESLANVARAMAERVTERFQGDMRVAEALTLDGDIVEAIAASNEGKPSAELNAIVTNEQNELIKSDTYANAYDAILVVDKKGIIIASTNPKAIGLDVRERDYFMSAIAGKTAVGQMFKSMTGVISAGVSAPVRGRDGSVIGVCVVTLLRDSITKAMSGYSVGKTGYFTIIDRTGIVVHHPDEKLVLSYNMLDDPELGPVAKKALSGGTATIHYTLKGSKKAMAYSGIPLNGWSLQASMPEEEFLATANTLRDLIIAIAFGALVLAIALFLAFARTISKPLGSASAYALKLSRGELFHPVHDAFLNRGDEIGTLAESFKQQRDSLSEVVENIARAVDNVTQGSQQLSATSQLMSQGASEQASSLEEISSSMEQMAANIRQNAENAVITGKIAQKSAIDAEEGGKAVMNTVSAMKSIASKTGIIEEIARSTNMLALNASIEAARAGEYGKGFAVVAAEVGKLAERSQKEAGEISALSTESVLVAERAGTTIMSIIPDIRKTADLVQEISASSNEQNSGAQQINQAILQLDQVVQQNASASEESASMSEELASQAEDLRATMAYFKLHDVSALNGNNYPSPTNAAYAVKVPQAPNALKTNRALPASIAKTSRQAASSIAVKPHGIDLSLDDDVSRKPLSDTADADFKEY